MVLPFPSRACLAPPNISKRTVIAMFEEGTRTREWLDSLDDDQWEITSFDPETRTVCFDLESDEGQLHHLSLTLPVLSTSKLK